MLEQNFGATGIEDFELAAMKYHYVLHYSLLAKHANVHLKKATVKTKGKPILNPQITISHCHGKKEP